MYKNPFFYNKGSISLKSILSKCNLSYSDKHNKIKVSDVKNLEESTNKDITFFHSIKYINQAKKTKARYCITIEKFNKYLPNSCKSIIVKNVLYL